MGAMHFKKTYMFDPSTNITKPILSRPSNKLKVRLIKMILTTMKY